MSVYLHISPPKLFSDISGIWYLEDYAESLDQIEHSFLKNCSS